MNLREWMDANRPGRGGLARFVREAESSFETVGKALRGEQIKSLRAAEKISGATGGEVSVAELMRLAPSSGKRHRKAS